MRYKNNSMQPNELISFAQVSKFLTGSKYRIRRSDFCGQDEKVNELISLVKKWMEEINPPEDFSNETKD